MKPNGLGEFPGRKRQVPRVGPGPVRQHAERDVDGKPAEDYRIANAKCEQRRQVGHREQ